jgi:hypothetical protein
MPATGRGFQLFVILITACFSFPGDMPRVQGSAPVQSDVWEPFQPVRDSTFRVIADPHAEATLNSESTWTLEWRPQRYVYPGTQIELRSLNLHAYYLWKYTKIEMEGAGADITFRRRATLTSSAVRALREKWIIARAHLQYGLRAGEPLRVSLTAVPPYVASHYDAVEVWYCEPVAGANEQPGDCAFVKDPQAQAILNVGPGSVQRLAIYSHPMAGSDQKVRTVLDPQDRYGNSTEFRQSVPVELQWEGKIWTEQLKSSKTVQIDSPEDIGRIKVSIPMRALNTSENISNGRREGGQLVVTGNPIWARSPDGRLAAFGEFHWHTEMSGDGIRSLPEGLAYAREHLNLDFTSPSDHTPTPAKWRYAVSVLNHFNNPDRFATFFGYEYSTNRGQRITISLTLTTRFLRSASQGRLSRATTILPLSVSDSARMTHLMIHSLQSRITPTRSRKHVDFPMTPLSGSSIPGLSRRSTTGLRKSCRCAATWSEMPIQKMAGEAGILMGRPFKTDSNMVT